MTCKDNCLYYELCRDSGFLMYHTRIAKTLTLTENVESECPFKKFKNKADFVEVVRCKDCDVPHNKWTGCPYLNGLVPPPDFYCAKGERSDT